MSNEECASILIEQGFEPYDLKAYEYDLKIYTFSYDDGVTLKVFANMNESVLKDGFEIAMYNNEHETRPASFIVADTFEELLKRADFI